MFFQGTLQAGISTALQQSKLVACFVTDDGEESQKWETDFLADDLIKGPLENQAVALRLVAGTQEAGFLEQLFPVPRKPTLVVIQNGQLKEYIAAGTSREEFIRRAGAALASIPSVSASEAAPSSSSAVEPPAAAPAQHAARAPAAEDDSDDLYGDNPAAPAESASIEERAAMSPQQQRAVLQAALLSRQRQEASQRAAQTEAAEKAAREARDAKARAEKARKEAEESGPSNSHASANPQTPQSSDASGTTARGTVAAAADRRYADELRQRRAQANEERRRVLQKIEDDKLARRKRDEEERRARELQNHPEADPESNASIGGDHAQNSSNVSTGKPDAGDTPRSAAATRSDAASDHCNLQVRLLDGSTIRHRFASTDTLSDSVRAWVDAERTASASRAATSSSSDPSAPAPASTSTTPYTFRVVLTPLPNRALTPEEETTQTLRDLGLKPSATLVLVPRPRAIDNVAAGLTSLGSNGGGVLARVLGGVLRALAAVWGAGFGLLSGIAGMIFGRGGGGTAVGGGRGGGAGGAATGGGGIRMQSLHAATARASRMGANDDGAGAAASTAMDGGAEARKRRREQQLYNGNSLNFEPREDDDEDGDGVDGRGDGSGR